MIRKYSGYFLIFLGVMLFAAILYFNSAYRNIIRPFSPYTLLTSSWEKYKTVFINKDGRVVDFSQQDITTSEGQSYAMLRAVFVDDKPEFDLVWKWTKENLKRPNDNLFGWRWGKRNDGSYGFMENGGNNSASDADTDIALALFLASKRWEDPGYKAEALNILESMWTLETDTANGKRYVIAGNWAKNSTDIIVNPSYFSPYAWRIFALEDKKNDWNKLIDPAYQILNNSGREVLDTGSAVGLPPDWLAIDKRTGTLKPTNMPNLTTNYSYDAIRIPWRIALDYQWNKDQQAYDYLNNSYKILANFYNQNNKLPTSFSHNGNVIDNNENPAMYATVLGYFMVIHPEAAKTIYQEKIVRLYSNDTNDFRNDLPYYDQNWLWFGAALFNKYLINFYS